MEAGRPSVVGCDAGGVGWRLGRASAGGRATDPVTSFFCPLPRDGGLSNGGINARDEPSGVSNGFNGDETPAFPAFAAGGAGVKLGNVGGASNVAVASTSVARDASVLPRGITGVVSFSAFRATSPLRASGSKSPASLASFDSKIPKSKKLSINWIDPTMIAAILAARSIPLARVAILDRTEVFSPPSVL